MTDKYRQAILIEAGDKNTVEQFINTMKKDVAVLEEHHPEMLEEIREVVCDESE